MCQEPYLSLSRRARATRWNVYANYFCLERRHCYLHLARSQIVIGRDDFPNMTVDIVTRGFFARAKSFTGAVRRLPQPRFVQTFSFAVSTLQCGQIVLRLAGCIAFPISRHHDIDAIRKGIGQSPDQYCSANLKYYSCGVKLPQCANRAVTCRQREGVVMAPGATRVQLLQKNTIERTSSKNRIACFCSIVTALLWLR
jgi:hypothetical protein